jgi:hypothetical protein
MLPQVEALRNLSILSEIHGHGQFFEIIPLHNTVGFAKTKVRQHYFNVYNHP